MQRLATGHQACQARGSRQQLGNERRCAHHSLEVVQHQQDGVAGDRVAQNGGSRLPAGLLNAQRFSDAGRHSRRVVHYGEVDKVDRPTGTLLCVRDVGLGKARFASPAWTGECEKADTFLREQTSKLGELCRPTEQGRGNRARHPPRA